MQEMMVWWFLCVICDSGQCRTSSLAMHSLLQWLHLQLRPINRLHSSADLQSSVWRCTPVSRTAQPYRWYGRPTSSPLFWHQSSGCTTVQTVFCWQPSFSGCRRQDLERTARQPRLYNILTDFSTPSKDIFVPLILLIALQWT